MDTTNRELLRKVTQKRLEYVLESGDVESEESRQQFREAMEAVDKQLELDKIDAEDRKHFDEEAFKIEEARKGHKTQVWMFVAGLVVPVTLELVAKLILTDKIGKIEQFESYTSTPGKSMSGWFRWKH